MDKLGVAGANLQNTLDRTKWGRTPLDLAVDSNNHRKYHELIRTYKMVTTDNSATNLWFGGAPYQEWRNRPRPKQQDRTKDWRYIANKESRHFEDERR